jgi:AsmA protein
MKAVRYAGAVVGVVLVVFAGLLAFGVPASLLAAAIQDRIERGTGYRLSIAGAANIGLLPTLNATFGDVTLQDPKDRDGSRRLTIGKVRAELRWSSLWSGRPEITDLTIEKPALYLPLLRERRRDDPARDVGSAGSGTIASVSIDQVTVTEGAVILSNPRDRVEQRIDAIAASAALLPDNTIKIIGSARTGERPLAFDITADVSSMQRAVPIEFKIDMPGTLRSPLSGRAELRWNGKLIAINNLGGMLEDGAFNGWASVDIASKPLLKLDLDLQRLAVASSNAPSAGQRQGWSTASIEARPGLVIGPLGRPTIV